jgi:hypothetical protein
MSNAVAPGYVPHDLRRPAGSCRQSCLVLRCRIALPTHQADDGPWFQKRPAKASKNSLCRIIPRVLYSCQPLRQARSAYNVDGDLEHDRTLRVWDNR